MIASKFSANEKMTSVTQCNLSFNYSTTTLHITYNSELE